MGFCTKFGEKSRIEKVFLLSSDAFFERKIGTKLFHSGFTCKNNASHPIAYWKI